MLNRVILSCCLALLALSSPLRAETLLVDDFETGLRPAWESKSFQGETSYKVVEMAGGHVLAAVSKATASGLVYPLKLDPQRLPYLSWRWKIAATVPGGDARSKATDDYAARVYVIFPSWIFFKTRTLNYIWANRLAPESVVANPFTSNAMMIAVESGDGYAGSWRREKRNLVADYRRAFGEDPPQVGAVAIMTDTDNTGTSARAWYDEILFSSE